MRGKKNTLPVLGQMLVNLILLRDQSLVDLEHLDFATIARNESGKLFEKMFFALLFVSRVLGLGRKRWRRIVFIHSPFLVIPIREVALPPSVKKRKIERSILENRNQQTRLICEAGVC